MYYWLAEATTFWYAKYMKRLLRGALGVGLLALPTLAHAAVFQDGKNAFSLGAPVADDLYVAGGRIELGETVSGDVFTAGQTVEISGDVLQDIYAAGQTVRVSGAVGDDVHAAGQDVTVAGVVRGDVFAAGQNVILTEEAKVGKDVYTGGAAVVIEGTVTGNVRASGQVTLAPSARIGGDVLVTGEAEPTVQDGAQIGGEVKFQKLPQAEPVKRVFTFTGWVRSVVTLFVLGLVAAYGLRAFTLRVLDTLAERPGRAVLTGMLWALALVPAFILLLITVVGIPLAFGLGAFTALSLLVATGIAGVGLGRWVLTRVARDAATDMLWVKALVGAVVYEAVKLLPVVGVLATCVLVLFVFGAALITFWRVIRGH